MKYKKLVTKKIEELENLIKSLDSQYKGVSTPYEKQQVYERVREKLEEISTLINSEYEDN